MAFDKCCKIWHSENLNQFIFLGAMEKNAYFPEQSDQLWVKPF
jgi:hypothetical protein